MNETYQILHSLLRTEKGTREAAHDKYLFSVRTDANKIQIKEAVEKIYKVKVADVNTMIVRGKLKRVRRDLGKTADWKRAVVTLKPGSKIELA